jgi:hypothetical protein
MDLGLFNVSDTYQYVLNQSGTNTITLGNGSAVNWNAGGVVALTGNQTISGTKTFNSSIVGNLIGNATTATTATALTNGVYTTGNQTISGIKSFANPISGISFSGDSFTLKNSNIKLASNSTLALSQTYYNIISGDLTSGMWLATAMALHTGSAPSTVAFRIKDTTGSVYASAMAFHTSGVSDFSSINMSTIINLTSNTNIQLQALSSATSSAVLASGTGLANSGSATQLSFVKIN